MVGVDLKKKKKQKKKKKVDWAVYNPGQMLRAIRRLPFLQSVPPVIRECFKVGIF